MARAPLLQFTAMEKEAIFLKATIDLIRDIVNSQTIKISEHADGCQVSIVGHVTSHYMNILLGDLLSESRTFGDQPNFIAELALICANPSFDDQGSVDALRAEVTKFNAWLETEITLPDIWLPNDLFGDVTIKRSKLLKINGNLIKHSFARLNVDAKDLAAILERSGHNITWQQVMFGMKAMAEYFGDSFFEYHTSTIVEFLNNIWWGIQGYMQTTLNNSLVLVPGFDPPRRDVVYPPEITDQYARMAFSELIQYLRRGPYIPSFVVNPLFKLRY